MLLKNMHWEIKGHNYKFIMTQGVKLIICLIIEKWYEILGYRTLLKLLT